MIPTIDNVKYLRDHRLWIHFTDDTEGEIDLKSELWGEMLEPLLDIKEFAKVRINKELGTIVWPNGADLAPEFLYNKLKTRKIS